MRKILLITTFFMCAGFVNTVLAQSDWRLGLKFNPIFSWARVTDEDKKTVDGLDKSSKVGFSGGLMVDYNFSERAAFNTGVHIVRKGYSYEISQSVFNPVDSSTITGKYKFDAGVTAVEIPLALKMRSGDIANGLRIRGLFGGALGLNVSSKTTTTFSNVDTESRKVSDFYQPLSIDFLVGAGVEYDVENVGTFDIGGSYHNGLLRFNKKMDNANTRVLLHYFSIDLGFYF